jgi:hypothetical protein
MSEKKNLADTCKKLKTAAICLLLPCKWQGKIENFSRNRLINPS